MGRDGECRQIDMRTCLAFRENPEACEKGKLEEGDGCSCFMVLTWVWNGGLSS